jgi:hypothetical protein
MKKHTRESQIKTVNHIKSQLGAYTWWKLCGTKASFFTKSELENHLWSLNLIQTLTNEPKIARKAEQLMRLLATVLKKEYNKESPVTIPQHRYIINNKRKTGDHGKSGISENTKVSTKRRNSVSLKDRTTKKKVSKLL